MRHPVSDPAIKITWDASCPIVGDRAVIPWRWTKKSGLKPSDTLKIQYRPHQGGRWKTIASQVRLDNKRRSWKLEGRYIWDTSNLNPGKVARYEARVIVLKKRIISPSYAFWIDHKPPKITITQPAATFEIPGPDGTLIAATTARGWTTLRAKVTGELRKTCYKILWTGQDPVWTITTPSDHWYFNDVMVYRVWATAIDRAGNSTDSEPLYILGLPGNEQTWKPPAHLCIQDIAICTPTDSGIKPPA